MGEVRTKEGFLWSKAICLLLFFFLLICQRSEIEAVGEMLCPRERACSPSSARTWWLLEAGPKRQHQHINHIKIIASRYADHCISLDFVQIRAGWDFLWKTALNKKSDFESFKAHCKSQTKRAKASKERASAGWQDVCMGLGMVQDQCTPDTLLSCMQWSQTCPLWVHIVHTNICVCL